MIVLLGGLGCYCLIDVGWLIEMFDCGLVYLIVTYCFDLVFVFVCCWLLITCCLGSGIDVC